jgi:outer membrane receptor protein involved in Fe transport
MERNVRKYFRQPIAAAIFEPGAYVHKPVLRALMLIAAIGTALMFGSTQATAQLNTATLQGTLTDSTGAVLPGVAIALQNTETSVLRHTVTGTAGEYFLSALQPGTYELTASGTGFQTVKQTNIRLEVGQVATLNFSLQVGNLSQTVEVAATGSSIANYDTTLGTVIGQQQVVDLPLNGRQFSQLLQLAPGVVPIDNSQNAGKAPNFGAGAASPGVNGQSNRSNLFFLDGMINSNPFFGGFSFSPSIDAIQEFKAQSHTDQAEFGQATGAIVSVITRPGTNNLHGVAFAFVRNEVFNTQIKNFSSTPQPKLPYNQNQFGGSLGGPILKDKLFFFANYEGGRLVQPTPGFSTVPTDAQRSGDFSGTLPGGVSPTIYDPATYDPVTHTVQPFAGNKIPANRIDPGMLAYVNAVYPHANAPLTNGANNLYTTTGNRTTADQGSIRIDYNLGTKNVFSGRYSQNEATVESAASLENIFATGFNSKNGGGSWNHVYSPTLISDVTVSYNALDIPQQVILPVDQDALFTAAGFGAGWNKNPGLTPFTLVPELDLNGGSYSGFWNGAGPIGPMSITQAAGSVTKVEGHHNLKFGASFYHTAMYTNWSGNNFHFSNQATWNTACQFAEDQATACPNGAGGDQIASVLLSLPVSATRNLGNTGVNLRQNATGLFAQDTWNATPKLTATYGLRWDYSSPVTETNNRLAVYNIYTQKYQIAKGNVDLPSGPLPPNVIIGPSNSNTQKYFTYFQPRLGVAYQLSQRTTFRAGFGRTFDTWGLPLQVAQQNRGAWPSGVAQIASSQNLNTAGLSVKPDGSYVTGQNPFYGAPVLPASPLPAGGLGFQDVKWQSASSFQWNAEAQQELGKIGTFKIGYVGSQTQHLTVNDPYNLAEQPQASASAPKIFPDQIFGAPGSVLISSGTGSYHSLQTQLSRSYSNGFVYNFTFTYSKSRALAVCGTDFNVCVQNPYNLSADRGPTNLDVPLVTTFNTAYQLPFGKNRQYVTTGPGAIILGDWQINSIITARSGTVINPQNGANSDNANIGGGNQRINFVGDPNQGAPHTITSWFNPSAFALPAAGTFGNAPLNSLRGPGFWNVDFSLFRDIPIYERYKFQFRAEAFNLFNHPNLANPAGNLGGGGFNTITSTTGTNRVIQLAGKLMF